MTFIDPLNQWIRHPVMNFRFNQSVVEMLKNVEGLTPAVPVSNLQGGCGGLNLLPTNQGARLRHGVALRCRLT